MKKSVILLLLVGALAVESAIHIKTVSSLKDKTSDLELSLEESESFVIQLEEANSKLNEMINEQGVKISELSDKSTQLESANEELKSTLTEMTKSVGMDLSNLRQP